LRGQQEADGSWFGRWGTNYIYGTWSVMTAFAQARIGADDPAVRRAVDWLHQHQDSGGGGGDSNDTYAMPAQKTASTAYQSAWALLALFLALNIGGIGLAARAYVASAAIILVVSIIETSYAMAYHDELTGLPSRRAFNDATLQLGAPYTVAGVDIDHFKRVNDTFGHETGDEVLCMVAGNLARVTGGGQAFRVGGEEFTILFPGRSPAEVMEHLEMLRQTIEESPFRLRESADRRSAPRGPDRRSSGRKKNTRTKAKAHRESLQVTVSIGIAEPQSEEMPVADVLKLADQALYAAKKGGRNRIEVAGPAQKRSKRKSAQNIA
jgi:diguanylate cyclase (GGDEF)-like protein